MSRLPSLKSAAVGAAVVGVLALAGCGAGQITQTSAQVSAVDGASGTVGQIGVRDASIVFGSNTNAAIYPAGGSAPLQGSIVNFGAGDDRLVSVSSTVAASVKITGDPRISSGRTLLISGGTPAASGTGGTAAPTPVALPPTTLAPSAGAAASTGPNAQGTTSASVVLTGLRQDIRAGLTYPVTFTFAKAGTVTVETPVANPTEARSAGG